MGGSRRGSGERLLHGPRPWFLRIRNPLGESFEVNLSKFSLEICNLLISSGTLSSSLRNPTYL